MWLGQLLRCRATDAHRRAVHVPGERGRTLALAADRSQLPVGADGRCGTVAARARWAGPPLALSVAGAGLPRGLACYAA
ncbi:hypothetical protein HRbin28_00144 [bacterium HR28]|nr:hypothetical protein HRbin28_00144 [bacterium HR28]